MKKQFLILFCLFVCIMSYTQQIPQYTHYVYNHFGINPAVAGTKECIEMRLGYRTQWVGFGGAPKTSFANLQARLPRGKRGSVYRYHGVGLNVYSDGIGPFGKTHLSLAYAINLKAGNQYRMAFGVYAGIDQFRFNASKVSLSNNGDPAISGSAIKWIIPDITPGFLLYSDRTNTFFSFTLTQLLRNKISIFPDTRFVHHYIFIAGKKIVVGPNETVLTPSIELKFAPMATPAIDVNVLYDYSANVQLGLSWRNTDAIAALLKVNFWKYFSFGYAFDFTTSKIRLASSNTHEIMLGINACAKRDTNPSTCPVF